MQSPPIVPDQQSPQIVPNQQSSSQIVPNQDAPDAMVSDPRTPAHATPARTRVALSSIVTFCAVFWVLPLIGLFFSQYITILLVIFLAVLFSTFMSPVVNALGRLHINRGVVILLVYVLILVVLGFVGRLALPLFTGETQRLANTLPSDIQRLTGPLKQFGITIPGGSSGSSGGLNIQNILTGGSRGSAATTVANTAVSLVFSVGQSAVFLLSILVMAFFLTVRRTFTADIVGALAPPAYRQRAASILSQMGERMGHWAIGQIIIVIYYAVAFSIGLTLLHVPYAFSIAVITGLLEIIPFVGGFIGLLLALVVAVTVSPITILWVIIMYLIITNVEAHILVPLVYGRAVHLHPFLVVAALLFGAEAFGLLGALIAVPLAAALQVGVENLYIKDVVEAAEQRQQHTDRRAAIDLAFLRRNLRR
jgi:predicted PurR-regulated permease PerM